MQSFKDLPHISYLVQPNQTYPTLAIMLEWLDDCEKEVYTQYPFIFFLLFTPPPTKKTLFSLSGQGILSAIGSLV